MGAASDSRKFTSAPQLSLKHAYAEQFSHKKIFWEAYSHEAFRLSQSLDLTLAYHLQQGLGSISLLMHFQAAPSHAELLEAGCNMQL